MGYLNINLDLQTTCSFCKQGIKYFKELLRRHKECYGSYNIEKKYYLKSLILRPDYNSGGYLTHWHIEIDNSEEKKPKQ